MSCNCEIYEICPECAPTEESYNKALAAYNEAGVKVRLSQQETRLRGANVLLPLRGLINYSPLYRHYISQCLETGSICTADDVPTLVSMFIELLTDEIATNLNMRNLKNLLDNPAPTEIWLGWLAGTQFKFLELTPVVKQFPFAELTRPISTLDLRVDTTEFPPEKATPAEAVLPLPQTPVNELIQV